MSKMKALVTAEVIRSALEDKFSNEIEFTYAGYNLDHNVMPHDELVRNIPEYDILICEYDTISEDVFLAAKNGL